MQHVITAGLVLQTGGTLMSRPVEQVHCSHYSFVPQATSYIPATCVYKYLHSLHTKALF